MTKWTFLNAFSGLTFEYNYGTIAGFNLELVHSNDVSDWRFLALIDEAYDFEVLSRNDSICSAPMNDRFGSFYSQSCQQVQLLGCDDDPGQPKGCRSCYYPERLQTYDKAPICQNSRVLAFQSFRQARTACFQACLGNNLCLGVVVHKLSLGCRVLVAGSDLSSADDTNDIEYKLVFPPACSLLTGLDVSTSTRIVEAGTGVVKKTGLSITDCIGLCRNTANCQKLSYSAMNNGVCLIADHLGGVEAALNDPTSLSFFKRPAINSVAGNFLQNPSLAVAASEQPMETLSWTPGNQSLIDFCLSKCILRADCKFVSIALDTKSCRVFQVKTAGDLTLTDNPYSSVFTRVLGDFSLQALSKMNLFDTEGLSGCFAIDRGLTQEDLSPGTESRSRDLVVNLGIGRTDQISARFFNFIFDAVETVGNFVVDTAVSVVDEAVQTVDGVVNTVGKVVTGDFEGALNDFMSIPIISDLENSANSLYSFADGIVTGDLEKIKEAGLGLAANLPYDRLIAGAGKLAKKGLEKGLEAAKKAQKKIVKKVKPEADDFKKKKKSKNSSDQDEKEVEKTKRCKVSGRLLERYLLRASSSRRPGDCDNDEEDTSGTICTRKRRADDHVDDTSGATCKRAKLKQTCKYDCDEGYDAVGASICTKDGDKTPDFVPPPKCTLSKCGSGVDPVITVSVELASVPVPVTIYMCKMDTSRKIPAWSAAYHNDWNSVLEVKRAKPFKQYNCKLDSGIELITKQAKDSDYTKSGWERGHLVPAKQMRMNLDAPEKCNLYINIAPQNGYINKGPWKRLENQVGCFMNRNGGYIVTGTCSSNLGSGTIGSGISIPDCFWKLICYKKDNKVISIGFVASNSPVTDKIKRKNDIFTPVSVAELLIKQPALFEFGNPVNNAKLIYGRIPTDMIISAQCLLPTNYDSAEAASWESKLKNTKVGRRINITDRASSDVGCTPEEESLFGIISLDENDDDVESEVDNVDPNEVDNFGDIPATQCNKRVIGYYPSWGKSVFTARMAERLTHVVYAFLAMQPDGTVNIGSVDSHDTDPEAAARVSQEKFIQLLEVAAQFPHLKVLFAVGGWENSQYFSKVAQDRSLRLKFISSVLAIIDKFGLDGVDLDWEYPVTGGAHEGIPADKENFVTLLKELRSVLDALQERDGRSEPYIISFAGAAGDWTLTPGYDLPEILKYADFANVMTYDYFGAWDSKWGAYTGPPAPLYFAMPPKFSGKTNADFTLKYYVCRSELPHKINMGVPFYGRFWENVAKNVDPDPKFDMWKIADPVDGKFVGGYLGWKDIVASHLNAPGNERHFNDIAKAPFIYNAAAKKYIGYEDPESLAFKVQYAVEKNLGGLMIWAIDLDDSELTMLDIVAKADLCKNTDPAKIEYKCSPLKEKRWWTFEDDPNKAGMCGRSAPLYKGYYPLCDPDDPGYSCCGEFGYCGSGADFCGCKTCKDYLNNPDQLLEEPIRPTIPEPRPYYLMDAPDGKRGRCGRDIEKLAGVYPICNPDDTNAHCCSNGGFCGATAGHCNCDDCVDFKANPAYRYREKTWWVWSDGADKSGRCGPSAPKINGKSPICNPDSKNAYCCSAAGYCGDTADHCSCNGCVNFKANPDYQFP